MRKILIVDDDPAIRRMLGLNFRSYGYDPLGATNGLQAEKILDRAGSDTRIQIQGRRIEIKRLALVWNSSNGRRDLFGAKIEDIDPANKLLMRKECNDDR